MDQQERAQVAFKVMGLWFIASAVRSLIWAWRWAFQFLREVMADDAGGLADSAADIVFFAAPILCIAFGTVLICKARALGRLLLPPVEPPLSPGQEALRTGTCSLGTYHVMAIGMLVVVLAAAIQEEVSFAFAAPAGVVGVLGVALLVAARRMPRRPLGRGGALGGTMLGAGVFLIGLRRFAFALRELAQALVPGMWPDAWAGDLADYYRHLRVGALLGATAALVLAVLVLVLSRRIAAWLAPSRDDGPTLPPVRLGGTAAVALAIIGSVAYLVISRARALVGSPHFGWRDWEVVGAALRFVLVPAAVLALAFFAAGRIAWPLARWLHPPTEPDSEDARPSLAALLEVAVAVLGLYCLQAFLWAATGGTLVFEGVATVVVTLGVWSVLTPLVAALVCVGMLAFKGDLARLACRKEDRQEPPREVRAALLRPWLVLLGVWFVLRDGPALLAWGALLLTDGWNEWTAQVPQWGALSGILLIVGAGWLAGKLSYGPLIVRRRVL